MACSGIHYIHYIMMRQKPSHAQSSCNDSSSDHQQAQSARLRYVVRFLLDSFCRTIFQSVVIVVSSLQHTDEEAASKRFWHTWSWAVQMPDGGWDAWQIFNDSDNSAKLKDLVISQIKFSQTQSWLSRNGATPPGNTGQMTIGKQITSSWSPPIPKQISDSTGRTNHFSEIK